MSSQIKLNQLQTVIVQVKVASQVELSKFIGFEIGFILTLSVQIFDANQFETV